MIFIRFVIDFVLSTYSLALSRLATGRFAKRRPASRRAAGDGHGHDERMTDPSTSQLHVTLHLVQQTTVELAPRISRRWLPTYFSNIPPSASVNAVPHAL